jgi:AraC-like DNA-binding protein
MRPLEGASLFLEQKAKLYHWRSDSRQAYSCSGEAKVRTCTCAGAAISRQPLFCRYVSRGVIKGLRMHRRRRQGFLSLEFVAKGELLIRSGEAAYVAEPGDICLLRMDVDHELFHRDEGECVVYGFILEGAALPEILKLLRLDGVLAASLKDSRELLKLWRRLKEAMKRLKSAPDASRRNAGTSFELLQLVSESVPRNARSNEVAAMLLRLEEGLAGGVSLDALAASFNCSKPTLTKRFAAELGETPYRHLIRMRLEKAAALLRSGRKPVKEIALDCGYANPLYFSGEFKRRYGLSPRAYRERSLKPTARGNKKPRVRLETRGLTKE